MFEVLPKLEKADWKLVDSCFACIGSQWHIDINIVKIDTADWDYLVTEKVVVGIEIDLYTNMFDAKRLSAPRFQINENGIYTDISLTEQVVLMIHPAFCHVIFLVNK